MKNFYTNVVKNRNLVIMVFLALVVVSLLLKPLVKVNYDINDYLPAGTHSTVSLEKMTDEFEGDIPNARVMVRGVTIPEALAYKEAIKAVEGVSGVTWLDDAADIRVSLSHIDKEQVEAYYKYNNALFSVSIDEDHRISAINAIREIIGEENAMTGTAVSIVETTASTEKEIPVISLISVIFVLLVLAFTTTSWVIPVLVLIGIGVAIALNGGTNLLFGEISFITNAAGSILQLAVSLDYSVFLIHRFEACRKENDDPEMAMVDALCKSTKSILSSGLTTVIGFLSLALMRFLVGPDLGFALAKGVAIGLITVFVFMPALILFTYKWMDKTRHRSFVPDVQGLGKLVRRVTVPMTLVFVIVMIPAFLASNSNEFYYGSSKIFAEGTTYGDDSAAIEEIFGKNDTYVLLVPSGDTATQTDLSDALRALPEVTGIISFVDAAGAEIPMSYLDEKTLAQLDSGDYSRMVISVSIPYEGVDTFALVESIREIADAHYPDAYYLAGQGVSTYDLMLTITSDMLKVNLLAICAVFLILLLTMRSVWLPVILVLSIETAVWLNLAVPYFSDKVVFYIAYLIISAIQLGATVDYAILMTDRYIENRGRLEKKDALLRTVSDVTVSILTSGSVLTAVGLLMGYISTNGLLAQLGIFIGRGAIFSTAIVFFVLPGLLYMLDSRYMNKKTHV